MSKKVNIVCFGEVLWDVFPDDEKIGGAPLNVALRLQSLNNDVAIISGVGNDEKGKKLLEYITSNGVSTVHVNINEEYKTGEALVSLDAKGLASYVIPFPCAWDHISVNEHAKKRVQESDAFVYGSLVCRNTVSEQCLLEVSDYARYRVFDVNLRTPHYTEACLIRLMQKANFIKFNDDELYEIGAILGSKYHALEQNLRYIAEKTATKHICVTKGKHGAVLLYDEKLYYNSGYQITVRDTVGAGDSFLAALIHRLLHQYDPQEAIDFACAVGALVTQQKGANPVISEAAIAAFMSPE
ncbi:MAG: carbohydrate kinase [Bacteroidota bacterium]